MNAENIAKNLRDIMVFLDWNQTELAEKLCITQAAVSQIVNGERVPSLSTIIKILKVTGVTFERLTR